MLVSIHLIEFQKMPEATRTESDAKKIRIFAENMDDNFQPFRFIKIRRGAHMILFHVEFDIFK